MTGPRVAFFGSSLVSSYWNGAATYYRGLLRALAERGWRTTFFEPDAFDRQAHRDISDPPWARVVVYRGDDPAHVSRLVDDLEGFDILVKASGVGVFDTLLEDALWRVRRSHQLVVFWDVDAPATIARLHAAPDDPFHRAIAQFDAVLTYGGGPPIVEAYRALGARWCLTIYNAVDPVAHFPVAGDARFAADVSLLANRLPDRETRIDRFLLEPARHLGAKRFLLGGSGWDGKALPANVRWVGHVPTADHNAFNCSATCVLSVNRTSMAHTGYSPATRIFEAAGAAACILTDRWDGIEHFFEPEREILVADEGEVADRLSTTDTMRARIVGRAAQRRVLAAHTYAHRAVQVQSALGLLD